MKYLALLLLAPSIVFAGGDRIKQDVDVNMAAENNTVVEGNTSKAFGFGMGDVDINDCYRSYQLLFWQDTKINPLCLADSYDAKGLHGLAAIIRCDVRTIRKHFASDEACVIANTATPVEVNAKLMEIIETAADKDDDDRRYYETQIQEQQVLIDELAETVEALKRPSVQRIVEREEFLTEKKRAALQALKQEN